MKALLKKHHPRKTVQSFKYAFSGVWHTLLNEANFRIQVIFVLITVYFGFHFNISSTQWSLMVLSLGMLLSAEMINTSVENFLDLVVDEYDETAKVVKDVAAGFVLVAGVSALLVFFLIFGSHFTLFFI